jgi:hypothetical protein
MSYRHNLEVTYIIMITSILTCLEMGSTLPYPFSLSYPLKITNFCLFHFHFWSSGKFTIFGVFIVKNSCCCYKSGTFNFGVTVQRKPAIGRIIKMHLFFVLSSTSLSISVATLTLKKLSHKNIQEQF